MQAKNGGNGRYLYVHTYSSAEHRSPMHYLVAACLFNEQFGGGGGTADGAARPAVQKQQ